MGLASALTTALTGLTAAETTIDVTGNNLANSQTVGFKASDALFATQFLQTQSLGSSPTANSGGTNPRQIGLGTVVAEIAPNFTQGTVEISANPTDLAIQGDGFFIVEGAGGETVAGLGDVHPHFQAVCARHSVGAERDLVDVGDDFTGQPQTRRIGATDRLAIPLTGRRAVGGQEVGEHSVVLVHLNQRPPI